MLKNPLHEAFATRALGFAPYGGADVGEVAAIVGAVGDGDDDAFYAAWRSEADRLASDGKDAETGGHTMSAREFYLHAACSYAVAYHPIYSVPVDPRLVESFHAQMAVFDAAMRFSEPPIEAVSIPYEHTTMPAYLIRAHGRERENDAHAKGVPAIYDTLTCPRRSCASRRPRAPVITARC